MKLKPNEVPNRISEAKDYLDYVFNDQDQNNHVYINVDKVHAYYAKAKTLMEEITLEMQQELFDETGEWVKFNPGSPKDMTIILTDYLNIPERDLMKYGKVSISKDVMNSLGQKYRTPFIRLFLQYREYAAFAKNLVSYIDIKPIPKAFNNEGDRIGKIRTGYTLNETYRMSTYDPHIQGINLAISDIITAPEGWTIVKVDSGQIEPRIYYSTVVRDPMINWLIEEYDDVYYALADYSLRESVEFREDNLFRYPHVDKNHRSTLKTLVNAGTYGSSLDRLRQLSNSMYEKEYYKSEEGREAWKEISRIGFYERNINNPRIPEKYRNEYEDLLAKAKAEQDALKGRGHELADRFFSRVLQHPQRLTHEKEIQAKINRGERTIESPFGDSRDVFGAMAYIKNCYLNNPLQMAVSRLSAISVCKAFEYINSNPKLKKFVRYAFLKHDEDVYYVRKEVAELVAEDLKKFREYEIEGWIKINSDHSISMDYTKD